MLWTLLTTPLPSILFVCALLAWWFIEPKTTHLNLIIVIGGVLFYWAVAPDLAQSTPARIYNISLDLAALLRLDVLITYHANMLVTGVAFLWLAHRAVQTLRKSVNDLVSILGVEVPDAPDVSLAGIRAEAATLNWTRPLPTRPVAKFTIQVNGVNVGDSANQETAITVTGLKPDHFYNVRVIAVGYNNFQAGSRVIRLRTFGRDGRPQLGDGRLPSNFVLEEQKLVMPSDHTDEDGVTRSPAAGVEAASIPDTSSLSPRDAMTSTPIGRRNTLTRKHSPSSTSIEQSVKDALSNRSEHSLQELGERFESIRKDIDETQSQIARDEREHKEMMDELTEEKKTKRRVQKEKDDTTEKLKKEMGLTERAMRSVQQRKTQKEKMLREKQAERQKLHDDMAKWEKDMASMRRRQSCFEKDRSTYQERGDTQAEKLRLEITQAQASLAQEEGELREKGKELKEAEEQRKRLPGGEESEEWRDLDRELGRNWDVKYKELQRRLGAAHRNLRMINEYEQVLQAQLSTAQQSGLPFMYSQANSSGAEFDSAAHNQLKRRSRNSNSFSNVAIPSPVQSYAATERPSFAPSSTFGPSRPPTMPPGFAQGPFMDHSADFSAPLDEEGLRALSAGAPLSPTATSLLPAGMLDDVVDYGPPRPQPRPVRHNTFGSGPSQDNDPQSPASSARSASLMSSPRSSSQHLPFSQYTGENSDRRSLRGARGDFGAALSPIAPPGQAVHRRNFLPWLHRGGKPGDESPVLGSLKSGQSQSFPRQAEDAEPIHNKRRISFSAGWNLFNRNSAGPDPTEVGNSSSRAVHPRRLGLGAHANSTGSNIYSERDPSSPRPMSIASSELPRPSTDSGSIWGRVPQTHRLWSPEAENPWIASRSASRRPSLHGSPSLLKTRVADADDEILDEAELLYASPSQVGIIGSKPIGKTLSQRLNPTAPTFMAGLFRAKPEKERDVDRETRDRGKAKGRDKEKKPRESMTSASEAGTISMDESPSESRKSRDAFSETTPSVTESRESLNLDQSFSNTPSDATGLGIKESESGIRKLLRKGSSSKFSLSSVRGLGSKKGPNSVASSDRNFGDRTSFDDYGEEGNGQVLSRSYDSMNSSPSIGPMSGNRSAKEKPVSWGSRFSMKKKSGKEKESLDLEREDAAPATPLIEEH
ncbi:Uu.00g035290.m01.CDS01 [Anthostomella pinea]|uniref:Uu.00g035290.m01.CDS01 n=1 Tax=Anthostomella pinea TaxID=933095 RepID=A0AAI8V977_9PEZI|nr:Uu.00g035290.m01.CDS01 [Anthostomella pinea]